MPASKTKRPRRRFDLLRLQTLMSVKVLWFTINDFSEPLFPRWGIFIQNKSTITTRSMTGRWEAKASFSFMNFSDALWPNKESFTTQQVVFPLPEVTLCTHWKINKCFSLRREALNNAEILLGFSFSRFIPRPESVSQACCTWLQPQT